MPRILIIEDDPTALGLMAYLFQAFGYEVRGAADGQEGLEAVAAAAPDLIVCDLLMPVMDGYEVGRRLKADPKLKRVPLVAVTALAMVGERERALAAGFDGYIPKPIVPETFVRQIEGFLQPADRTGQVPQAAATTPAAAAAPVSGAARQASILVVDDSPVNLQLFRSMLEPLGYEIFTTLRPAEALGIARERRLDLIISDLHMPGESGFELVARLTREGGLADVPFLLVSSSSSPPICADPGLAEQMTVVLRPVNADVLIAEIERCLARSGARRG